MKYKDNSEFSLARRSEQLIRTKEWHEQNKMSNNIFNYLAINNGLNSYEVSMK
jgi:hypothetical protein